MDTIYAVTAADIAAAETLINLLYGGESGASAHGAQKTVALGSRTEKTKPVVPVSKLEVTAVIAGPARMPQQPKRRQRVPKRRWSSSSSEEDAAVAVAGDVPIGTGRTIIPREKYLKCRWQNYRFATRSFLDAVFPKTVLASHSVTGKPSPAFAHLPAKKRLNPVIIRDIVIEVSKRYKVPQSAVRAIVTTKCADEAKISKNSKLKAAGASRQGRGRRTNKKPQDQSGSTSSDETEI